MTLREKLIRDAKAFCERDNISLGTLARRVVNDGKFFDRVMRDGDCTTGVYERFQSYFAENGFDGSDVGASDAEPPRDAA